MNPPDSMPAVGTFRCRAVLFDLDGTVLDTAPDLLRALNVVRERRGLPMLDDKGFRLEISRGARAMLGYGLPGFASGTDEDRRLLVEEFLAVYQDDVYRDTILFPGMAALMDALEAAGIAMAIVTNKPERMAVALLEAMGLAPRFPVILGGDSLPERKPHPMPARVACDRLGVHPATALFVGDDPRDIDCGRAAGCRSIAVRWGYTDTGDIEGWGADAIVAHPRQLLAMAAP